MIISQEYYLYSLISFVKFNKSSPPFSFSSIRLTPESQDVLKCGSDFSYALLNTNFEYDKKK